MGEIVKTEMWLHEAEDAVAEALQIPMVQAVHLIQFAIRGRVLRVTCSGGKVRPAL